MNFLKKLPLWIKIVGILLGLILLLVISFYVFLFFHFESSKKVEKMIDKKFHEELAQVPELKVEFFQLWDGDSIVHAEVKGKGPVNFWYGERGVPRIVGFGGYQVPGRCLYTDEKGERVKYGFHSMLVLDNDTPYKKWFPFEVNNLRDLVDRYDDIAAVLNKFPTKPEMTSIDIGTGSNQEMVKNPNPDYVLKYQDNGRNVHCDLFRE